GDDHVVGGDVERVDVADGLDGLRDFGDVGDGLGHDFEAARLGGFLGLVDLDLRVDLAGGVDDADAVGVGHQFLQQVELLLDGGGVGGAGDVGAGLLHGVDEFGGHRVRDGGEQDRDVL